MNKTNKKLIPKLFLDPFSQYQQQYGFGSWLLDAGKAYSNLALGTVGIDPNYEYESETFEKIGKGINAVGKVGGQVAANVLAPGVGGAVMGGVQSAGSAVSQQVNPQTTPEDAEAEKQRLTQLAFSRLANGGFVPSFNNNVTNQLLSPIAGSIQRDKTQSEYDELGQKKVLSDLSGGRIEYGTGGNLNNIISNMISKKDNVPTLNPIIDNDILNTRFVPQDIAHIGIKKQLRGIERVPKYDWDTRSDIAKDSYRNAHSNDKFVRDYFSQNHMQNGGTLDFMMSHGGQINERRSGIDTPNPDTAIIKNGGTHEQSPLNGVPIGNKALVEQGEVIYKSKKTGQKYVFSAKF